MRLPASKIRLLGLLIAILLSLSLVVTAAPSKRGRKPTSKSSSRHTSKKSSSRNTSKSSKSSKSSSRRILSAKEAGAVSVKKVQIRSQLKGIQKNMRQVQARIRQAKAKEHRITDTIETVTARISRTQGRLITVRGRLRELGVAHDQVVERIDQTRERLAKRRSLLARRVRDNYERGQATYIHVLLQSRTLHELLSRNYYVRAIVRSDAGLIEDIKRDLGQIEADKRRLEVQQREQDTLEQEFETRKAEYVQDRAQQRELLNDVQVQRHRAEDQLDDLEEEAQAMTSRIRALSEMLRRREEAMRRAAIARRRQQERERKARGQTTAPPSEEEEDYTPRTFRGGFIHPVNGRMTSGFGYRFHPILRRRKLHTGVDFGVASGTPIRAAASGTILLAGYSGGYGKCVIIYHGDGVTTLYGHCSALLVSEGQEIKQGQVIARSGSTGMSTGPHLHFEVRCNGTPVRPF